MRRKWRWIVAAFLTFTAGLAGLVLWFGNVQLVNNDPPFRGKPESEWIKNLKYLDDQQVKEWRAYGEEGVQVLIRGLKNANRPRERAYRKFNRRLPVPLRNRLPDPKRDSTEETRGCIVSLLWSLGSDARSATRIMIDTATYDEADGVRQSAIGYFNSLGRAHLLEQLPATEKKALVPALIAAMQDSGNWGLRGNAAIALKWFPEHREAVAPVLLNALQDSELQVRLSAAGSLNRVAPDIAKRAGATSMLIALAKNPDDQLASKAVEALGHSGSQPDLAVPALVECLQSTNTLLTCQALWALEWAPTGWAREWTPQQFTIYSNTIVPALRIAAERKDVAGYARAALARWRPKSDAK